MADQGCPTKTCSTCSEAKPLDQYYSRKNNLDGLSGQCRKCVCKQTSSWFQKNKDRVNAGKRAWNRKLRREALEAYGAFCQCCGESAREFLAIDHINGGGSKHRKSYRNAGNYIFLWLRKHAYPKGFQVLCHNCNFAKSHYGGCPHNEQQRKVGVPSQDKIAPTRAMTNESWAG